MIVIDIFDRGESMSNACFTIQQFFFYSDMTTSGCVISLSYMIS
jgi:hypothetical protein